MNLDLQTIQDLVNLAGNSATTVGTVADVAGRLKSLFKSPQTRADAEVERLIAELTSDIAKTQFANAQLHFRLTALLLEMQKANEAKAKLARYSLCETEAGDFVYEFRGNEGPSEPPHYACPKCFEDDVRSILQTASFDGSIFGCKVCKSTFAINRSRSPR